MGARGRHILDTRKTIDKMRARKQNGIARKRFTTKASDAFAERVEFFSKSVTGRSLSKRMSFDKGKRQGRRIGESNGKIGRRGRRRRRRKVGRRRRMHDIVPRRMRRKRRKENK